MFPARLRDRVALAGKRQTRWCAGGQQGRPTRAAPTVRFSYAFRPPTIGRHPAASARSAVGAGLAPRPSSRSRGVGREAANPMVRGWPARAANKGRPYGSIFVCVSTPNNRTSSGGVGAKRRRGGACSPPVFAIAWRWPGSGKPDGARGQQGRPTRAAPTVRFSYAFRPPTIGRHPAASARSAVGAGLAPRPSSRSRGVGREAANPMVRGWPARAANKGRPYGSIFVCVSTPNNRTSSGGVGAKRRRGGACSPPVFAIAWRWPGSGKPDGARVASKGGQQGPPLRFDFRMTPNNRTSSGGVGAKRRRGGACSPPVFAIVALAGKRQTRWGCVGQRAANKGRPLRVRSMGGADLRLTPLPGLPSPAAPDPAW